MLLLLLLLLLRRRGRGVRLLLLLRGRGRGRVALLGIRGRLRCRIARLWVARLGCARGRLRWRIAWLWIARLRVVRLRYVRLRIASLRVLRCVRLRRRGRRLPCAAGGGAAGLTRLALWLVPQGTSRAGPHCEEESRVECVWVGRDECLDILQALGKRSALLRIVGDCNRPEGGQTERYLVLHVFPLGPHDLVPRMTETVPTN